MDLCDWLPSYSRDHRRDAQAGVLWSSIHCLIGTDPLVVCHPLVDKEQASANQRPFRHSVRNNRGRTRGRASANQRPPHHWVWRVLSSATGDPYKLRCVSALGSVLEFLLLRTLQTGAVGGTPTALTLEFTGKEASSRSWRPLVTVSVHLSSFIINSLSLGWTAEPICHHCPRLGNS